MNGAGDSGTTRRTFLILLGAAAGGVFALTRLFAASRIRERIRVALAPAAGGTPDDTVEWSPDVSWAKFTMRARRVIFFAQEEAARRGDNEVGTEHLLLGLVREDDSVAARILDRLGVPLGRIRSDIERQMKPGPGNLGTEMQLTSPGKRVVNLAFEEARLSNDAYLGTEHILLGLIREGKSPAARVLVKRGATLDRARRQLYALHQELMDGGGPMRTLHSRAHRSDPVT